jgi:nucleoid-associated protein
MEITEAIVHGIQKVANNDQVIEVPRISPSEVNDMMSKLANDVLDVYTTQTSNYGTFSPDPEFSFQERLRQYYQGSADLVSFTTAAIHLIANAMRASLPSTGGYTLFLRYSNQGRDWLLIVMLKLKTHTGIDPDTLDLNEALAFDIQHLHEAARIDLGKWSLSEEPYLSFVKRSGREEVTRYFRQALGCTSYTDSRQNTLSAMAAVKSFAEARGWTQDLLVQRRKTVYEYFEEKRIAGEAVNLTALSAVLDDQDPGAFHAHVRANDIAVNETFAPHRSTYSRWRRIKGQVGTVKVSFDVEDVASERVAYDPAHNSIVIRNISPQLAQQIREARGEMVNDG